MCRCACTWRLLLFLSSVLSFLPPSPLPSFFLFCFLLILLCNLPYSLNCMPTVLWRVLSVLLYFLFPLLPLSVYHGTSARSVPYKPRWSCLYLLQYWGCRYLCDHTQIFTWAPVLRLAPKILSPISHHSSSKFKFLRENLITPTVCCLCECTILVTA